MLNRRGTGIFYVFLALQVLILPLRWVIAVAAAAAAHELCHLAALAVVDGRMVGFRVGFSGAVIEAAYLSPGKRLLCILAGPVGGLLPVALIRVFPELGLCAVGLSVFNLLPVAPLDGANALLCVLQIYAMENAQQIVRAVGTVFLGALLGLGLYIFLSGRGMWMLVLALMLILRKNSLQSAPSRATINLP